jgi:hypothetical protein
MFKLKDPRELSIFVTPEHVSDMVLESLTEVVQLKYYSGVKLFEEVLLSMHAPMLGCVDWEPSKLYGSVTRLNKRGIWFK